MTLIEKAQQDFDEAKAKRWWIKLKANTFDFNDFIDQLDQVNKMGPLEDILKMIPGLNKMAGLNDLKVDPKDTARMKAIVLSMTHKSVKIQISYHKLVVNVLRQVRLVLCRSEPFN